MARPVAYGCSNDCKSVRTISVAASQNFQANGGRFVYLNSSRHAVIASGGNILDLIGWADVGTYSGSTTAGADKVPVNVALGAEYEIPINATRTEAQLIALVGKVCDLETSSGVQYANYDAATDKTIQIVGYKYYGSGTGEQSLLVRLYGSAGSAQSATLVA
jgi:hypothetical protein